MTHTDIKSDHWTGRRLPGALRPYALLARLDRPVGIWLLLLPGWWAIALAAGSLSSLNGHDIVLMALFGIGAVVMRAAGCVVNDLWDMKYDRQVERTKDRPLASGALSPWEAGAFLLILLTAGFNILSRMTLVTMLLGILALPLVAVYPLMKRLTWWPQLFLGLIFNFGALMGWSAVSGTVDLPALLLYAGGILWTLGYDTIYAQQDVEDDARIGIRSTALKFGPHVKRWVAGFYAGGWGLIAAGFVAAHAGWPSLLVLLAPGLYLIRQVKQWDIDDPASCLRAFRASRDFGLLVLLAAAL